MTLDCSKTSLRTGATGSSVTELQKMLKDLGYYNGAVDGYYGSLTYRSVKKFQGDTRHSQDGWFGAKTCKSLNELHTAKIKTDNTSKSTTTKSIPNSNITNTVTRFKLEETSRINPSVTFFAEVVNLPDAETKNNSQKLHQITVDNLASWNMNRDADGLTHEASISILFDSENMGMVRLYQKARMVLKKDGTVIDEFTLNGYVNSIKLSHSNDLFKLDISICGYTEFLNKTVEEYNQTLKRSEHCKKLIGMCGLKADINLNGLTDDTCTINTQKSEDTENADGTSSNSSSSAGSGATMTLEEIYSKASSFKYGGIGTGLNPEKAWNAYQNGGRTFDCYDCSNFLFYCLKNFAKIPCRIVQGYSPYASSGTHRVVQIKENGSWHCPKQAWNLTRNLRPFTPEDKYSLKALMTWEG